MRLRVRERHSDATMLHAYTTEVNLAHVALCRGRCVGSKQIFAKDVPAQYEHGTEKGQGRTNFHSKHVRAVHLPPLARRVPDPQSGLALDLGIATHSDFQVCSADRDVQSLRFEESWARAMPHAGSVSARPSSVNEEFCVRREMTVCEPGRSVLACISRLLAASPCQFAHEKDRHEGGHRP